MKILDCFSGYGGFTLAGDKLGIETIGFMEVDKYANSVLAFRYPEVKNYGDIDSCSIEELPDFDILTGGFPCQDLSIAGGRKGLSGGRSGLFYRWLELLEGKAPSYFILENVRGLFSSQKGWDFADLLNEVASTGYDVQWGLSTANGLPLKTVSESLLLDILEESPDEKYFLSKEMSEKYAKLVK